MLWHFLCKCEGPTPPRGDAKKDQGLPGLGGLVRADSDGSWVLDQRQIDIHHQLDEVFELRLRLPAYLPVGIKSSRLARTPSLDDLGQLSIPVC